MNKLLAVPFVLVALSGCGGSGSSEGPCDELIADMYQDLGVNAIRGPVEVTLNGDTGLFYEYDAFLAGAYRSYQFGFYYGPSFDGCELELIEVF